MFNQPVGTGAIEYPITAILGIRGSGKTLLMTAIAYDAHQKGFNIFANYTLYGIPYTKVKGKQIEEKADMIKDGILLVDEMREAADSYSPFKATPKQVATFAAQSRKRRITIFYSAQDLMQVAVRVRRLTDLVIEMNAEDEEGYHQYRVLTKDIPNELIKDYTYFFGKPFFEMYDTNEIVTEDEEDEKD